MFLFYSGLKGCTSWSTVSQKDPEQHSVTLKNFERVKIAAGMAWHHRNNKSSSQRKTYKPIKTQRNDFLAVI